MSILLGLIAVALQSHIHAGTSGGLGQTRMMSSQDIIFAAGDELEPGMMAEIAVAWPPLLDGHIRLQLVLETAITGGRHGVTEARILA